MHYRPHSFDTKGFFFGVKVLAVLALFLVGVRYGTAFASDMIVREGGNESVTASAAAVPLTSAPEAAPHPTAATAGTPRLQAEYPAPKVSAKAFIVADLDTGETYAAKDEGSPHPIASISKLLVALAARETLSPQSKVTITKADRAQTEGTPGSIQRDETFSVADLFYPLLMESNNSVAYALERAGGGDEFVRVMLRIAHDVGMDETLLNDSSGLSPKNEASARDLVSLARHITHKDPALFEITRTRSKSVTAQSGRTYAIANLNIFMADPAFLGGKTGYTDEAHQTMLTAFDVEGKRIAIIVLGSADRKADVQKLLAWFKGAVVVTAP